MDTLKIAATANGVNYLPEYLADAAGLFTDAGLVVEATPKDPWTGVLDDLASGDADLALGGLWVPAMFSGSTRELTVVCQLNHQFPMAILLRESPTDVQLSDLRGKSLLAPGAGGSAPFAFTAGLIRESGTDPAEVRFIRDLSTAMAVELYQAGLGDGVIADLGTASELQAAGFGTIVFRHLDSGGLMPNSVYYCQTTRVEELRDRVTRFVGCIDEAMRMTRDLDPALLDQILAERWPSKDRALMRSVVDALVSSDVWGSVAIDVDASDRWMRILTEEGLVSRPPSYTDLADDSFMKAYR
jgi:NitT/TauT family transport system substrate-binding protein